MNDDVAPPESAAANAAGVKHKGSGKTCAHSHQGRRRRAAAQARMDSRARAVVAAVLRDQADPARAPAAHGVRGSVVPEHRRMLRQGHGDVHDHGRHLHAALSVLRRRARPSAAARCRRARESRADDRRAAACATSSSPASIATICGTAVRSTSSIASAPFASIRRRRRSRCSCRISAAGSIARSTCCRGTARRDEPQSRDGAAAVPAGAAGLRLRAFAAAAAGLQAALRGCADQVRPDGGPGRDRRRNPVDDARHARARHRHADDRPVPAAVARSHLPVLRYVHPDTFAAFERDAYAMGFRHAAVGAMVRSSYHADRQAEEVLADA